MAQYRDRLCVAAIELGSVYSGYGWSTKMDIPFTPSVLLNKLWVAGIGSHIAYRNKTLTALLLNPDQSFRSFGFDAEGEYFALCEYNENYQDYFYFHRFNDTLNKITEVRTTTMLEATNSGKVLPAQHIYAHAIRYFKDHLFKSLNDNIQNVHVRICDILFVLVVPSTWDDGAVQFIQEAANIADIPTDQQLIVSECEAGLAYYHYFLESEVADQKEVHKPGKRTLIVDIGGGALKLSVVKKNQTGGHIKEFDRTICKIGNGNLVNEAFYAFLDDVIGNGTLEKLRKEKFEIYTELFRNFEVKKRTITTEQVYDFVIRLPTKLLDIIQRDELLEGMELSKYSNCICLLKEKLWIYVEQYKQLFKPAIDGVLTTIDGILCGEKFPNIEHIFLHGGFANCQLLQQALFDKYGSLILIPEFPERVVIIGAVLRGLTLEKDASMIMEKRKLLKDNSLLFRAVIGRDKEETEYLINANMDPLLPDEFGETPFHMALDTKQLDVVKLISNAICKQFKIFIQSRYGNLLYKTWMGYTLEQEFVDVEETFKNICIVGIYTKQPPCTLCKNFRHIPIRWRQKEEVSDEGKLTTQFENINVNSENTLPPKLAKMLFNEHSNLTILHYSSVKSTNFPTELKKLVKKPCLALYCHIKGIIPLGEKQFKETVSVFGAYEIDVREGYCYLNQSHIRPGTAIYCPTFNKYGTAGGFVEDSVGNTAMVTAAHIVTDCELRRYIEYQKQEFLSRKDIQVLDKTNSELIGKVKTWCFENRNFDETSVDAAVIEVDRRIISTDSMFPDTSQTQWNQAGYTSSNRPRICTNKLISREEISSNRRLDVIKYGMSTQITIGNIIYDGAYFKPHREEVHADDISPFNMKYDSEDYIMCRQLGVQGRGGQPFSEAGDSGAFCCMIDNNDETVVRAFGMVIAGSTLGVSFVTPLENVFQALGMDFSKGIKLFPQNAQTQGPTTNQPIQGATANQPTSNANVDPILQQLQLLNASFQQMVSKQEQIVSKQEEMVLEQQNMRQTFDARFHLQDQKIDSIVKNRKK